MEKHLNVSALTTGISFALLVISILLHNLLSGLLGKEEPVFFALAMILGFIFPFALLYLSAVSMIFLVKKLRGLKK